LRSVARAMAMMPFVRGIATKIALTTIGVALPSVIYVNGNAVVSEITPVARRETLGMLVQPFDTEELLADGVVSIPWRSG
jgi:hypothetical protein